MRKPVCLVSHPLFSVRGWPSEGLFFPPQQYSKDVIGHIANDGKEKSQDEPIESLPSANLFRHEWMNVHPNNRGNDDYLGDCYATVSRHANISPVIMPTVSTNSASA